MTRKKKPKKKTEHRNKPISLAPLSFDEAVERLVNMKPDKSEKSEQSRSKPRRKK